MTPPTDLWHNYPMRPPILTDDVLAEIDLQSHIDATEREPTDAPSYGESFSKKLIRCQMELAGVQRKLHPASMHAWDEWVRLP